MSRYHTCKITAYSDNANTLTTIKNHFTRYCEDDKDAKLYLNQHVSMMVSKLGMKISFINEMTGFYPNDVIFIESQRFEGSKEITFTIGKGDDIFDLKDVEFIENLDYNELSYIIDKLKAELND